MVTRNIKCMGCEFEGKVEAHDTVGVEGKIFKSLGKDSNTGYLLFRCPSCGKDIAVDPLKAIRSRKMKGYPVDIGNEESEGNADYYDDALDMVKMQILKLAKSNFMLWLISIIFIIIARSTSKEFLNIIALIILVLMLIKSIKLTALVKKYFNIIYEMYGPHANVKRNSLIANVVNIGILGLVILLFLGGSSNWYTIPLILVSLLIFVFIGASLSGK